MRRGPLAVVTVCVLLTLAAAVAAVQQHGVAAQWRSLEQQRQRATTRTADDQGRQLTALRKERDDLQSKLDALAAKEAARGDQSAEVSVLAARSAHVRENLSACTAPSVDVTATTSCAVAADQAQQILDALNRVATGQ